MVILTLDPNYYVCINLCVCPSTKVLGSVGTRHVDGLLTRCGMLNKPQLTEGGWCWLPAATCLVFALNKASLTKKLQLFVKKTDDRTLPLFLSTLGVHSLQSVSSIMQKKKVPACSCRSSERKWCCGVFGEKPRSFKHTWESIC